MSELIEKALQFAAVKHEGHHRKGTLIPYITHPVCVAFLLKEAKASEEVIAAGLLHDTIEDTSATEAEVGEQFGDEVLRLVQAASEPDKTLPWEERKRHTVEDLKNRSADELALITADKLHNVRSIELDAQVIGGDAWLRFNRGKRDQSWYYMSIVNRLKNHKKDVPLVKDLSKTVYGLFTGKKKLKKKDIALLIGYAGDPSEEKRQELEEAGLLRFADEVAESAAIYSGPNEIILLRELFGGRQCRTRS
ncbi:HD domain-containing protein [Planococcus lenghuensis]|uniref:HD/PDEase domain-containing protein n=1 Tax=Planococcus lenghuensis TaxID=2213202 RepID=A0A1Q2L2S9_9BACL|nr:HD domain-containing protein [Planococcus lenghuensis]AQQ54768.1 hypothetical protein B0X71_17780 [Planococcus lenghuensis]